MNINARWIWTAILAVPLVAGCNRAESPSEVQEDVAEAQRDAAENVAEEREDLYTAQPTD
jgi:hypothetical protein